MARLFLRSMLKDLYKARFKTDEMQEHIAKIVDVGVGVTVPISYGILSNIFKSHTIPILTILPSIAAYYIVCKYTLKQSNANKND